MTPREVLALCREREIQAVDLRFMDFPGTQKHFTIPAKILVEKSFEDGFGFDGSSMRGWKSINESDMLVVPQPETAFVDPFMKNTLVMTCNIQDPITREDYAKDPRNVARKAESYMRSTKIADVANFGPEAEFLFLTTSVSIRTSMNAITMWTVLKGNGIEAKQAAQQMPATRFVTRKVIFPFRRLIRYRKHVPR